MTPPIDHSSPNDRLAAAAAQGPADAADAADAAHTFRHAEARLAIDPMRHTGGPPTHADVTVGQAERSAVFRVLRLADPGMLPVAQDTLGHRADGSA